MWGVGLIAEAAARLAVILHYPVHEAVGLANIPVIVIVAALMIASGPRRGNTLRRLIREHSAAAAGSAANSAATANSTAGSAADSERLLGRPVDLGGRGRCSRRRSGKALLVLEEPIVELSAATTVPSTTPVARVGSWAVVGGRGRSWAVVGGRGRHCRAAKDPRDTSP